MLKKIILPLWIIGGIFLLLYSFTQVDLSLTLSQASFIQDVQKGFQHIGWFSRPLSTYLYIGTIIYLFSLFVITIYNISKKRLTSKTLWMMIIIVTIILIPSYNAFSYDLFNYIFDARIVSHYNLSPYEFKPLDFPGDAMLSFMRSTHRVYPYGPTWLGFTVPLTYVASEVFVISLALFKIMSAAAYLGTCYFIKRIAENLKIKNPNMALALFALNPLVIIEGIVSAHNEIVMMFFAVLAFYLLFKKRRTYSLISLAISIGIKYATAIFLPVILAKIFYRKLNNERVILFSVILSAVAIAATSLASGPNKNPEFQPWYLLIAAPIVPLYENKMVRIMFVGLSFTVLFSYIPFLFNGMWPENIVNLKNILVLLGISGGVVGYYIIKLCRP